MNFYENLNYPITSLVINYATVFKLSPTFSSLGLFPDVVSRGKVGQEALKCVQQKYISTQGLSLDETFTHPISQQY